MTNVIVIGGSGLIGNAILNLPGHEMYNYDRKPAGRWLSALTPLSSYLKESRYRTHAVIDCARYDCWSDQIANWQAAIDHFLAHGGGRLILFSSIYGHKAPDFTIYEGTEIPETSLEYSFWKGGTEQAVRHLAQKYKTDNIQVNAIAPGGVLNGHSDEFQIAYLEAGTAPMIAPSDILPVVEMLLHPDNKVNGQVVTVDGGWSL